MQFSKLLKGAVIILPLIAATACSTSTNNSGITTEKSLNETEQLQRLQQANTVLFDFDKYNIKSDFSKMLDAHAEFLRTHPAFAITIEGHTDERGTPEYNIALGERRAAAVKAYLQGRGVSANQISIKSYGKEKPAVLGHDENAHSKNRRAVIVY